MDWSGRGIVGCVGWGRDTSDSVSSLKVHGGENDGDEVQVVSLEEILVGCIVVLARDRRQSPDSGACLADFCGDDDRGPCPFPCLLHDHPTSVDCQHS